REEPPAVRRGREARPLAPERSPDRGAPRLFVVDGRSPVGGPERGAEKPRIRQEPSAPRRGAAAPPRAGGLLRRGGRQRWWAVPERQLEIPRVGRRSRDDGPPGDERGHRDVTRARRGARGVGIERFAPQTIELR